MPLPADECMLARRESKVQKGRFQRILNRVKREAQNSILRSKVQIRSLSRAQLVAQYGFKAQK